MNAVFHISAVRFIRGEPKFHESTGTTGHKTHRGFCSECGSPLAAKADLFPQIHGISVASLDDPGRIKLDANIWTGSVQSWDYLNLDLPQFAGTPTEDDLADLARTKAAT